MGCERREGQDEGVDVSAGLKARADIFCSAILQPPWMTCQNVIEVGGEEIVIECLFHESGLGELVEVINKHSPFRAVCGTDDDAVPGTLTITVNAREFEEVVALKRA